MIQRLLGSVLGAVLVTLALVTLMQSLVAMGGGPIGKRKGVRIDDFLRTRFDTDTQSKKRELPEKEEVEETPEVEEMELEPADSRLSLDGIAIAAPQLGGIGIGTGTTDMDIVPLVRVNPRYPPRAQSRGIEGWVHLRFSITPQGTVGDVQIVDSYPKGYFERAAKRAVQKYKYKPKVEDGVAVPRTGVELVLSFDIEE